jgi:hypothetical protein
MFTSWLLTGTNMRISNQAILYLVTGLMYRDAAII